ncbi:MBL fold metallo-hydrolase [Saccharomonospora piscinae]|uniref:MBL fold metallo-hydrolase n=1 Tax=Saccharomonospora piscinae TaxID=687388 RepID=UPI001106952C|nr:MBL fold metallo-hydrolase [Saccharomonospora piscinae]TLW94726.1 MBL fold metallo-hydrolase [Saccharomonospora piscinae]
MSDHLPLCVTCGTQYARPRADCPVCEDERQYVPREGQRWTDLATLRAGEYTGRVEQQGPGLVGIGSRPSFGIGQRALLVRAETGNVLWDCAGYLDDDLVASVRDLGGITAIAISHPHYYTTMVEWSHAFDVPVILHENDRQWVARPDPAIKFWNGRTHQLADGLTLLNLGVHFAGGTVLHWRDGEQGAGALLSGDIVQVIPDRTHVGFMYSYPNLIPERPDVVREAARLLEPYSFEAVYGAWWDAVVPSGGGEVVQRSARRYLDMVGATR